MDWFSGDDGHYSVVVGIDRKYIHLQDPELGKVRSLDIPTFRRVWFDFPGDMLHSHRDLILRRMIVVEARSVRKARRRG